MLNMITCPGTETGLEEALQFMSEARIVRRGCGHVHMWLDAATIEHRTDASNIANITETQFTAWFLTW